MRAVMKETAGPGVTVRDVDEPSEPEEGVLLEMVYAGICGSDLATYRWEPHKAARLEPRLPLIIGHEGFGKVVATTPGNADRFPIGTRVALEPVNGCMHCPQCRRGTPNLCRSVTQIGTNWQGTMAEQLWAPARACHVVPDSLTDEQGALLEVLGVAVHAVRCVREIAGASAVVVGPGAVGQFLVQVLRAYGAGRVTVVARASSADRLELALALGADDTVVLDHSDSVPESLRSAFDVSFEAAGKPDAMVSATKMTRAGGTVVGLGGYTEPLVIDYANLVRYQGIDLLASRARVPEDWDVMARLIEHGRLQVGPVPIRTVPLASAPDAFELAASGFRGKVLLDCRPSA